MDATEPWSMRRQRGRQCARLQLITFSSAPIGDGSGSGDECRAGKRQESGKASLNGRSVEADNCCFHIERTSDQTQSSDDRIVESTRSGFAVLSSSSRLRITSYHHQRSAAHQQLPLRRPLSIATTTTRSTHVATRHIRVL